MKFALMEAAALTALFADAMQRLDCTEHAFRWWSWPEAFGSTAGPRGGIGGQAITEFQVFRFENDWTGEAVMWCAGVWRKPTTADHVWHGNGGNP